MADDTKARKNKNINFRMPEESEEVLVEDGVSSASGVEKDCLEVTIH